MAQTQSELNTDNYVEQAIVQLLALKIRAGAPIAQLRTLADECLRQAASWSKSVARHKGLDIHRLGSVLRSWHKETVYLTHDGLPRPLTIEGKASLRSLVRRHYPAEKFEVVFRKLVETNLIVQLDSAQWVPSGGTARISQHAQETLEYLAEGVARYVTTVTNNVTAKRAQDVLFERSCKVTKLPAREIEAFREYVGLQALAFLTSIDDWLESRSSKEKRPKERHCTAGVYTFAYIAETKSVVSQKKKRRVRTT